MILSPSRHLSRSQFVALGFQVPEGSLPSLTVLAVPDLNPN